MIAYLDSSALLSSVLGDHPTPLELTAFDQMLSSDLIVLETARTRDRLRLEGRVDPEADAEHAATLRGHFARMTLAPIEPATLESAARPLHVVLGSLDSIHLATAMAFRTKGVQDLVLATHDVQLARAARQEGFEVIGDEGAEG